MLSWAGSVFAQTTTTYSLREFEWTKVKSITFAAKDQFVPSEFTVDSSEITGAFPFQNSSGDVIAILLHGSFTCRGGGHVFLTLRQRLVPLGQIEAVFTIQNKGGEIYSSATLKRKANKLTGDSGGIISPGYIPARLFELNF